MSFFNMTKKNDDGISLRGRFVRFNRGLPELDEDALKFGKSHANNGAVMMVALPLIGLGVAHAVHRIRPPR